MEGTGKKIEYLVVDTSAFIQNVQLQNVSDNIITCQEVINEITNRRQLKRLVVLPYDLKVKNVFPDDIRVVTEFAKKTGDYPSLSSTDIKVLALTYQLEKEKVGTSHLRETPLHQKCVNVITHKTESNEVTPNIAGFFNPNIDETISSNNVHSEEKEDNVKTETEESHDIEKYENDLKSLKERFESLECSNFEENLDQNPLINDVLEKCEDETDNSGTSDIESEDDDEGWITPNNISLAKKKMQAEEIEEKEVKVACMTTDFAMQNVLKQMNLNVSALDGKIIKQLRTFILRCYTCFKTTSIMTKIFCPKCGNKTLKKVAVSLDENGKMQIHINARKPLSTRGKNVSVPKLRGGKHPNNPILSEGQPMPHNRPSRLARTKTDALDDAYIAGYSPFVMRDISSKSAQLCIKPGQEMKYWMKNNSNEGRRRKK